MANVTLSIDDRLLQAARVRAVREGTSVNEVCRKAIENYARAESGAERAARFRTWMRDLDAQVQGSRAAVAVPWNTRDEMYGQILQERHPTLLGKRGRGRQR